MLLVKITTYIKVVCIQIVLDWGNNRGCGINRGNIVSHPFVKIINHKQKVIYGIACSDIYFPLLLYVIYL